MFGKISRDREHVTLLMSTGFVTLYWNLFSSTTGEWDSPNTVQGVTAVLHHHLSAPCCFFAMLLSVDVKPEHQALTAHDSVIWTAILQEKRGNIMSWVILVMNRSFIWTESTIYSLVFDIYLNGDAGQFRVQRREGSAGSGALILLALQLYLQVPDVINNVLQDLHLAGFLVGR